MVIDDSIVRGTTMVQLVRMLRQAGAAEVHVRINSPEVVWPCFYGIDTDVQAQLISANRRVEEIRDYIGADSLAFLSVKGLLACMPPCGVTPEGGVRGYCTACFTGVYPVAIPESFGREQVYARLRPLQPHAADGAAPRRGGAEGPRTRTWESEHL